MSRDRNRKNQEANGKGTEALWGLIVVFAVIGSSQPAGAQPRSPALEQANLTITLRMYNYAVSRSLLNDAEAEATAILEHAGIEAAWVDCPLRGGKLDNYPACQSHTNTTDFVVYLITRQKAGALANHESWGRAMKCSREAAGCVAYVFYRHLAIPEDGDASDFQVLGHAIAHEIGHLLLGPNSHSVTGIMRGEWNDRDLRTVARGHLFFTAQQSDQIRKEVSARNMIRRNQVARAEKRSSAP